MEDFIDVLLVIVLIFIILIAGLFIFLMIKSPATAYMLLLALFGIITLGIGVWMWRFYRKKRMGPYQEMIASISQSRKEMIRSTRKLDRHLRKVIQDHFPKINQLCREVRKCILKIREIDAVLSVLETKHEREYHQYSRKMSDNPDIAKKMMESNQRYRENIRTIQASRDQHLQRVQQVLQFLQELNSQVLALRYSHSNMKLDNDIAETIDDLLIGIHTLGEIS